MEHSLKVKLDCKAQINLAMQQNYIPLIRSIRIENQGENAAEKIHIKISFSPEFAASYEADIAVIAPEETAEISPVRIIISPETLSSLTERLEGVISIDVSCDGETIISDRAEISLLAADQWLGINIMPELTAAYITPNHPAVMQIINKAAHYLMKWNNDPSFTGYQTQDPNAVKLQMAAIYAALQEENIAYTMPPASYELTGQRVRMPHSVIEQKCGTCLDLSLLYSACAEAVGLHPLIVFIKGHAFSGCWLENETFADCATDDLSSLTKRTAEGISSICLVECTDFVAGKAVDFDRAVKHANDNLLDEKSFSLAVDIHRCRGNGIRPLPIQADGKYSFSGFGERKEGDITSTPAQIDLSDLRTANTDAVKTVAKQDIWERKLLDLSLRNGLINFRPGASSIQIVAADLGRLEDELARGESFKIMPAPSELSLAISDSKIYEIETAKDLIMTIAEAEFKVGRLRTFLKETELEASLKKLHRKAKLSLEENGANTLYLALSFLCWYETDKSVKRRYAPLVLVPVDIIRKISDKAYSVRIRNEDTQMNVTLLEMLRQDFGINIGGLDPLPEDESGVDLQLVFNTMRRAVLPHKRWDIEEIAFLGQFSFGRFIMWNDIHTRSDQLRENKVVQSLISGKMEWQPKGIDISPRELDEKLSPDRLAIPTSIDSSQLSAVYAASEGESFVLHGPPGTGKSQTITNMIANALYHGKSVLFVAEKMAALSVVQNRLKTIGLDPFCLELHSNKAQKRAVLDQLESTLSLGHIKSAEEYTAYAQSLKEKRRQLSETVAAMHKKMPVGMSLYSAIIKYEQTKEHSGKVTLADDFNKRAAEDSYNKAIELIDRISIAGRELNGFADSPLKYCRLKEYSFDIRDDFFRASNTLYEAAKNAERSYDKLAAESGFKAKKEQLSYRSIMELFELANSGFYLPDAVYAQTPVTDDPEQLDKLVNMEKEMHELKVTLLTGFDESLLTYDINSLKLEWKTNEQKWFLSRAFGRKRLLRTLRAYSRSAESVSYDNFIDICEKVEQYQKLKGLTDELETRFAPFLGKVWQGEDTSFNHLAVCIDNTAKMRDMIVMLNDDAVTNAVRSADTHLDSAQDAIKDYKVLCDSIKNVNDRFSVDMAYVQKADDSFEALKELSKGFTDNADHLRERVVLENLLCELDSLSLGNMTDMYRCGAVDEDTLKNAFECSVSMAAARLAISEDKRLSSFQGAQFDESIKQYKELTEQFRKLTVQELISKLSAKIPTSSDGLRQGNSELSILQRAIKSGGRMLSIRSLFDSIPTLLRRICPCMLMSPISVAQYIDPGFPKFDIVIFDEASQMPTSEAVGAIARGESVVVVGDPKQLPPTSFFTAQNTDEENFDKEDLESVLDDCLALSMPQKHLLWHYRSRHESLIAFSNARFYENKLLTFPSPDDRIKKVTRVQVNGFYDKSRTRQNLAEAEAVVSEIVRRLSDEKLRRLSIGVVTFSSVQQNLIDDLLSESFVKNPKLEEWADKMYEPIFIKNLENVQGDERDVILFSIGYGPDQNGKVSMNFGPINQDGGWRRLNVAVSRARQEMIVYSVLRPDQIDLTRTRAAGVAELKSFLEFAERGTQALARNSNDLVYEHDELAGIIADELIKRGYDAKCEIGCSGFKVDIAISDNESNGEFILGIILDSFTRFSGSSVDDMRITQPGVLKGLGWSVMNVHILDWFDNPASVLTKIEEQFKLAKQAKSEHNEEDEYTRPAYDVSEFETEQTAGEELQIPAFTPCVLPIYGQPDDFTDESNIGKVISAIRKVIEAEAPVSRNALIKKVLSAWGITRKSKLILSVIDRAFTVIEHKTTDNGSFIWRIDQTPEEYCDFRSGSGDSKRKIEDICLEEICAAVIYVLKAQVSLPQSDLILAVARIFGYSRVSAVEERVMMAARSAQEKGLAVIKDGMVMIIS